MPYHRKRQSLGDVVGTVQTAVDVTKDPYFSETVCHVQQLSAINNGRVPTACAVTPPGMAGGVGLGRVQSALRAYVYAEQNPWVYPVAIAAGVGIPLLLGYLIGKES